ncbi:uncharacterized protein [Melanerpes formicivorus]|uniref:uncharacterized protein isoform X2 n=1 Tax=Melanerpes formicivorus TaxID=211600 RepID=UPI00358F68F3
MGIVEVDFGMIKFLLFKCISQHGEVFYKVPEETVQPGDIVLVPMQDKKLFLRSFIHAAVYLGDGEVIHFQGRKDKNKPGRISKEGFHDMKEERGKCEIWRKRGGIDLKEFRRKVKEAMNSKAKYHLGTNNCIHFALWLLGLADFYTQMVEIQKEDGKEEAEEISDEDGREEAMSIPSGSPSRQGSDISEMAAVSSKVPEVPGWVQGPQEH